MGSASSRTWPLLELHQSAKPRRPAPPSPGHKGTMPAPTTKRLAFTSVVRWIRCLEHQKRPFVEPRQHAPNVVEARVPWLQSWKTRFDGRGWIFHRAFAVACSWPCNYGACEKAAAREAIDICKGQVSALIVSYSPAISPSSFLRQSFNSRAGTATCLARCLSPRTPRRTIGSLRSLPLPSFLRRLVMEPTMSPTAMPLQWLPEPSQCPKLVCSQSSQSL